MGVERGRRSRHAGICTWTVYNGLRCSAGRFPEIWVRGQGWREAVRGEKATPWESALWLGWGTNRREGGWVFWTVFICTVVL